MTKELRWAGVGLLFTLAFVLGKYGWLIFILPGWLFYRGLLELACRGVC